MAGRAMGGISTNQRDLRNLFDAHLKKGNVKIGDAVEVGGNGMLGLGTEWEKIERELAGELNNLREERGVWEKWSKDKEKRREKFEKEINGKLENIETLLASGERSEGSWREKCGRVRVGGGEFRGKFDLQKQQEREERVGRGEEKITSFTPSRKNGRR